MIKKQESNIHNIPIAKITGQISNNLHKLEQLDWTFGDFIYMAATLIYLKSKMPASDPLAGPEELEDPRAESGESLGRTRKIQEADRSCATSAADRGASLVQARSFTLRRRRGGRRVIVLWWTW